MKKIFKYFGILIALAVSFLYTEKTALMVKDVDEIMLKIKDAYNQKKEFPIQAIVDENSIIPGINGYEIDINRSYRKMRYAGKYNESLLEYKTIYVDNQLSKNMDKVILAGNKKKNSVAMIIILTDEKYIDSMNKIVKKENVSIFVSGEFVENNSNELEQMSFKNNIVGTIGYANGYDSESFPWLDNKIKKISNIKYGYCLSTTKEVYSECERNNNFTIFTIPEKKNFFLQTKRELGPGKIFSYYMNDSLLKEIDTIFEFLHLKGYKIVKLDELLRE